MMQTMRGLGKGVDFQVVRDAILQCISQPVTATQLSWKLEISLDRCSNALHRLQTQKQVRCLNPRASRNILYWVTRRGIQRQRELRPEQPISHDFPPIDWNLYASVCYAQRSDVIKSLCFPMQPSHIKRRAAQRAPGRRMSANNVRDVIRYLKACEIVRAISIHRKALPRYELTTSGLHMRRLLLKKEVRA
jgi:hypothetical protein